MKLNQNKKKWMNRLVSGALVMSFGLLLPYGATGTRYDSVTGSMEVYATQSSSGFDQSKLDEAKQKKKEAEQNVNKSKTEINTITGEQKNVKNQISSNKTNLATVKKELEETKNNIVAKQDEIDKTTIELQEAQRVLQEQYDSMKLRIQFMYENNTDESLLTAILTSNGLAEMLVRLEYISDVHRTDRELLEAYDLAMHNVEDQLAQLGQQMKDLISLRESYESKQAQLEATLSALAQKSSQYASDLEEAKRLKSQYEREVSSWAEVIRQQEALAAGVDPNSYAGGGTGKGGLGSAKYLTDDSYNPDYKTSISPDDLCNFALQYVGNPYKWGGNSLTNGCDCSGFVNQVYKNFGISTVRYSQAFLTEGSPVSFNNMKKGDVVVYPGHVAIYLGNGCIVEAQSTKAGITSNRPVKCHTITGIRRLL